jgi:S1-C subfamily serine protease
MFERHDSARLGRIARSWSGGGHRARYGLARRSGLIHAGTLAEVVPVGRTFDVTGKVIGINSGIVSPTGGSVGIGFAIPAETVRTVVANLRDKGKVVRGWLGVSIQAISPETAEGLDLQQTQGALVAEPQPNSPAAGIQPGDIITSLTGQRRA